MSTHYEERMEADLKVLRTTVDRLRGVAGKD